MKSLAKRRAISPLSEPQKNSPRLTSGPTGCSWNSNDVITPKFPPPPRIAQNKSGCSRGDAVRVRPSAVTTSAERRLSELNPARLVSQPMPPPSVSPPMPVWLIKPPVTASPCCWLAASRSPQVAPPPTTARRAEGSTATWRMALRSIIKPSSQTAEPAKLCPPPRTEISSDWPRPNLMAWTTSAGTELRAMSAGRRLMAPFQTDRAVS